MALPITGKTTFPEGGDQLQIKVAGYRAGVPSEREVERLQQAIPIPSGPRSPQTSIVYHQ
jgi:hypothetical protein